MPLKLRRFYTSILLVLFGSITFSLAQSPTSGDVMRERISKAKAFIAVRNYNAAIYELENIRRETADPSVQGVVNVLLMNSYLEQSDYKRAQDFLNEFYNQQKTTKPGAQANYFAVAAQVVSGARNRVERYSALGLNVSDRTLPLEAVNDIEKMRETLELVITQSKEIGKDKAKGADAMALLEEAANSRSRMARDDYDARHWRDEIADTREQLASSRSVVINAVNDGTGDTFKQPNDQVAASMPASSPVMQPVSGTTAPAANAPSFQPVPASTSAASKPVFTPNSDTAAQRPLVQPTVSQQPVNAQPQQKPADTNNVSDRTPNVQKPADESKPVVRTPNVRNPEPADRDRLVADQPVRSDEQSSSKTDVSGPSDDSPLEVGSLVPYATKQTPPVYPPAAKTIRQTGLVKVEVTVDETGQVSAVQKVDGPSLLQAAAKDAIRKWRFRPFVRDGQPVKANGFINFNFSL
jgi:TonB family protein